jgi:dihydrofolate reductase
MISALLEASKDQGRSNQPWQGGDMRRIVAALITSLDGLIEGPNGELDWVDSWEDPFDLLPQIDTCILGGGMYPGYEQYWSAILANPGGILPLTGKVATKGEIDYAHFAARTPHIVVSRTLDKVGWTNTRIVRDLEDLRTMKAQPGKDMHAVGGATLVSSLMNAGLIDELRIVVQPIVLGRGKALFKDVKERHALTLLDARPLKSGVVRLTYRAGSSA